MADGRNGLCRDWSAATDYAVWIPIDRNTDVFMLYMVGIGISLFMSAIFFPLFYWGGEERNEIFLIISLLCGTGIVIGLTTFLNTLFTRPMTTMQIVLGGVIIFICAFLTFLISCPVTVYIYYKKQNLIYKRERSRLGFSLPFASFR